MLMPAIIHTRRRGSLKTFFRTKKNSTKKGLNLILFYLSILSSCARHCLELALSLGRAKLTSSLIGLFVDRAAKFSFSLWRHKAREEVVGVKIKVCDPSLLPSVVRSSRRLDPFNRKCAFPPLYKGKKCTVHECVFSQKNRGVARSNLPYVSGYFFLHFSFKNIAIRRYIGRLCKHQILP